MIVCLAIMELTGQNQSFDKSPLVLVWTFIAPAIVWYFGINEKKKIQKGKLSFKEGVKEGFKISLVFGLTSPFVFLFYYLFVNPPIISYVKSAYGMSGSSDGMVIAIDMVAQFVSAVVFGTIYAAIISLFIRSK